MKTMEQLAILTALKKAVEDRLKEVRQVAKEELEDAYYDMGVEKIALKIDGQKVGDFTITYNSEGYEITDKEALNEFALDYGLGYFVSEIKPECMDQAIKVLNEYDPFLVRTEIKLYDGWDKSVYFVDGECVFQDSGMVIPGLKYKPKEVKTAMVRGCKPEDVLPITRRLGGVDNLLLGE